MNREQNLEKLGLSFIDPLGKIIGNQAQQYGLKAFIVGGVVRDALLNRPSKDFDICVSGSTEKMAQAGDYVYNQLSDKMKNKYELDIRQAGLNTNLRSFLQNCGGGVLLSFLMYLSGQSDIAPVIYPRFLVGMIKLGGEDIEFVATRTEDYDTKEGEGSRNRNPGKVEIASEYEDAIRRDFTMNALYVNLATGELLDPTGKGLTDIKNKTIRVTREGDPEKVFLDDPLRILRAIRQSAQLGFSIDPKTSEVIKKIINKKGSEFFSTVKSSVSAERIRDEFSKILLSKNSIQGIQNLLNFGILDIMLPEVAALAHDKAVRHKNLWEHTLIVLNNTVITPEIEQAIEDTATKVNMNPENLRSMTALRLKLSALLHDVGKIETRSYGYITCPNCGEKTNIRDFYNPICERCKQSLNINIKGGPTFHQHQFSSEKLAKNILQRLKFDHRMTNWVSRDCALHQVQFGNYEQPEETTNIGLQQSKKMLAEKLFANLVDMNTNTSDVWDELNFAVRIYGLVRADSSAQPQAQQKRVNDFISAYEVAKQRRQEEQAWREFNKPILSGEEIMEMFNIKPGKWIGNIHKQIREDKLNNPEQHNREKAIQIAEEELAKWGPEIYNK